jgi:hypothetical protein
MGARKLPYDLGTWFAVPLPSGGYGVGVVTRANKKGFVLGYFFGPRYFKVPTLNEVYQARPSDASLVQFFGDLGLIRGEWPILGNDPNWRREDWPTPGFFHRDSISGRTQLRYYDENKLGVHVREEPCDSTLSSSAPHDGLAGQKALEIYLDRALPSVSTDRRS